MNIRNDTYAKKYKALGAIVFIGISSLILLCACGPGGRNEDPGLDEMVGEMLMRGFRGTTIDSLGPLIEEINKYHCGGVILFEYDVPAKKRPRNIVSAKQLKGLCKGLQEKSDHLIWIAIDQEGGMVNRLKAKYGFQASVSAEYLGNLDNADSTGFYARQTAVALASMGINLNFAPVVDLNINKDSPAIGKIHRSFSDSAEIVVKHAGIIVDEHRNNGVISCLKHFPGHGSATADSHEGFTDVSDSWMKKELYPYKQLIKENKCDMVMTAHVFNSHLDPDFPASMSKKIINGMLRQDIAYNGLIISDDMMMKAISEHYGLETAIEKAINAGVDILIFSNNIPGYYDNDIIPKAFSIIKKLLKEEKISSNRIRESYERIQKVKARL